MHNWNFWIVCLLSLLSSYHLICFLAKSIYLVINKNYTLKVYINLTLRPRSALFSHLVNYIFFKSCVKSQFVFVQKMHYLSKLVSVYVITVRQVTMLPTPVEKKLFTPQIFLFTYLYSCFFSIKYAKVDNRV